MVCHQNYLHIFSSMVNKSTDKEEPVTDINVHLSIGNLSYKKYKYNKDCYAERFTFELHRKATLVPTSILKENNFNLPFYTEAFGPHV